MEFFKPQQSDTVGSSSFPLEMQDPLLSLQNVPLPEQIETA